MDSRLPPSFWYSFRKSCELTAVVSKITCENRIALNIFFFRISEDFAVLCGLKRELVLAFTGLAELRGSVYYGTAASSEILAFKLRDSALV